MEDRSSLFAGSVSTPFKITFFILRLVIGGLMLEAGILKLTSGSFVAAGFLGNATGPFAGFYMSIASNAGLLSVTDVLVPWGETLIGVAIILGIFVRFASFWAMVLMVLYYTVDLPPSEGWIADQVIYFLVFLNLIVSGAGYFLGLDYFFGRLEEKRNPVRILLG